MFFRSKLVFRQDTHQILIKYTDFWSIECSDFLYTYCSRSSKLNSCPSSHQSLQPVSARQISFITGNVCHLKHFRVHKWKSAEPLLQVHKVKCKCRIMCKTISSCSIAIKIGGVIRHNYEWLFKFIRWCECCMKFHFVSRLMELFFITLHCLKCCCWWHGIPHNLSMVRGFDLVMMSEKRSRFQYLRIYEWIGDNFDYG